MKKIINLIKENKKIFIPASSICALVVVISFFTYICILHFQNINENYTANVDVSEAYTSSYDSNEEVLVVPLGNTDENENSSSDNATENSEKEQNENRVENNSADENKIKTTNVTSQYYIKVNCYANTITVYTKDSNGNFTVPCKAMVCSTGYASPQSGVYKTKRIGTWHTLFGGVYGQYCTQITGNILFHSVPYTSKGNNASLEYWAYDKLGTTASAGCIRLQTCDALWIYNNCGNGTQVEFYRDSNPRSSWKTFSNSHF